ncbi:hypothetical protein K2173_024610 [Erythroxylum novogranatense]|uniref:RanBD1 domain-containing protein n=1 Tax=Erythroxylum novogranatense TaxID=1862640 RepID=A0AAV8SVW4_9ROSI|nr:hypothetical protein K2173_024610 [Erythroxylum novogranatense]
MGDAENTVPPSKKRAAGREISKDNPGLDDDEDSVEQETGTFKRASDEVLASRRIVKVRRSQTSSTPAANPFAGIRLVPPSGPTVATAAVTNDQTVASGKKVSEDTEEGRSEEVEKDGVENPSDLAPSEPNCPTIAVTADDIGGSDANISEDIEKDTSEVLEKGEGNNLKHSETENVKSLAETATHNLNADNKENDTAGEAAETKVETTKDTGDKIENEKTEGDKAESEDKKDNTNENVDPSTEGTPLSSFQQLSSTQNAFTGLAGTGFSASTFTFGSFKDGSAFSTTTSSIFGQKSDQPSFGFSLSNNGSSSLFSTSSSTVSKSEGSSFPSMQEVPVETGEENEKVVFAADSVLFEYLDGAWKERGKGEVKVNISTTEIERARLLMRCRGNYRLILNASLYPDMKLTNMDKRGITFACMNCAAENKDSLSTYALKFKDGSIVEEFRAVILAHKGKADTVLKTPENSPKASEK